MAFDGFFMHCIKNEISDFAIGSKVDKIFLPTKYELVFLLRTRTEQKKLFISVAGNSPRINFTSYSPENPSKPPMICMLLRKQLQGAVITGLRQKDFDRILFIDFDATNDIGERVKRTLVVEIMAQYSNCILLDENGFIIDALKRVDSSKSSFRQVLPKQEYVLPPSQDKLSLFDVPAKEITEHILLYKNEKLSKALLNTLSGASPLICRELAYRTTLGDFLCSEITSAMKERLCTELVSLKDVLLSRNTTPCYITDIDGEYREFSFIPITQYSVNANCIRTSTLSELPDIFYVEREKKLRAHSKAEDLFKLVSSLIERTSKKINIQCEELKLCENADYKRIFAELITANIYSLNNGAAYYDLPDYYNNYEIVRIPADPALSPSANAQKYFKDYRKAQTARKVLKEQIEKSRSDMEYLLSVKDELSRAESEKEISAIRQELGESGYIKSRTGTKNKNNVSLQPIELETPDGYKVIVGRNNIQNDNITFKKAHKTDMWFHVKNAPGSHVILMLDGAAPSVSAMEFAAQTAAYYSSLADRGMAEVDYMPVKNIKKPPASKPGFVIYHTYNTMYIKTDKPVSDIKK